MAFDSSDNIYYLFFRLSAAAIYWLTVLVVVAVCTLPIIAYKFYMEQNYPGIDDYYRRVVARPQDYPGEKIRMDDAGRGDSGTAESTAPGGGVVSVSVAEEGGLEGGATSGRYDAETAKPSPSNVGAADVAAEPGGAVSVGDANDVDSSTHPSGRIWGTDPLSRMKKAAKEVIRRNRQVTINPNFWSKSLGAPDISYMYMYTYIDTFLAGIACRNQPPCISLIPPFQSLTCAAFNGPPSNLHPEP